MDSLQELYDQYRQLPPLPPEVDGKIEAEPREVAVRRNALMREMIQAGKAEAGGLIRRYAKHADVESEIAYQLHLLLVEKRVQEEAGEKVQNFPSLFKTALTRRLIDEWRSENRHPLAHLDGVRHVHADGNESNNGFDMVATAGNSPVENADRRDTARQIAKAWWERLRNRPQVRETYLLVHYGAEAGGMVEEGGAKPYKLREAAEILDVPLGTIKSRLAHADAVLDELVQKKTRDRAGELLYNPEELSGLLRAIPSAIQEAGVREKAGAMAAVGDSGPGRGR